MHWWQAGDALLVRAFGRLDVTVDEIDHGAGLGPDTSADRTAVGVEERMPTRAPSCVAWLTMVLAMT